MQAIKDFLVVARQVTYDLTALEQAANFLDFKLQATDYLREQILQIVNKGVSTFEWVPETLAPGARTGPVSRETESLATLFFLNLNLDTFLAEATSARDALLKFVNVAFDLRLLPLACKAEPIHGRITKMFRKEMGVNRGTGIEAWGAVKLDPQLEGLISLRNESTHQNLVTLVQTKAWKIAPPPPGPGKWRGEFSVVVSATKQVPLDMFVGESSDKVRERVRVALHTLQSTLDMLMWQRGGPKAAALRRTWRAAGHRRRCPHGTIEHVEERVDSAVYGGRRLSPPNEIYYCCACGERVRNIRGRTTPDGSTHW